jgi:NAD+ kinase
VLRTKKGRMKSVAVVVRPDAPNAERRAQEVSRWLSRRRIEVLSTAEWVSAPKNVVILERAELMRRADLVIVLGGDGSLLGIARLSGTRPVPVVGMHHGDFGFLTESASGRLATTLKKLLDRDYRVTQRTMLSVRVLRKGAEIFRSQALNDAVVHQGRVSRMLSLDVEVNGEFVARYSGDGLVMATPTGSTAYSLSAGGPVVVPDMGAMLLTPISPHTLSVRPMVLPDSSRIGVSVGPRSENAILTLDGQQWFELAAGDEIEVTKSRHQALIVKVEEQSFFETLRNKLHWGARGERRRKH